MPVAALNLKSFLDVDGNREFFDVYGEFILVLNHMNEEFVIKPKMTRKSIH